MWWPGAKIRGCYSALMKHLPADLINSSKHFTFSGVIATEISNLTGLVKIAEVGITDSIPLNASSKEVSTSVNFKSSYINPIVIATLCGGQGYIGAGCKVMNITSSGAVFRTYTTTSIGGNYSFYISYIVLEKE